MLGLLKDLGLTITQPTTIFSDSKVALQRAVNPVFHERTKHIKINYHFVREKIQQGLVTIQYVHTRDQPADLLTKVLTKVQHEHSKPS